MKAQREDARQAAISARNEATENAKHSPRLIEDSQFRRTVMQGLIHYRKLFDSDAAMGKAIGTSQSTVNKILSGKQDPRLELVGKAMDALYANLQYPWEPKNDTKKISLTGGAAKAQEFRAVMRFDIIGGAISMTEEAAAVLPMEKLGGLCASLSLGAFVIPEDTRKPEPFMMSDLIIVDFTRKPSEGLDGSQYLVKTKDGGACIAQAWESGYVINLAAKDVLKQGKDYDDFVDAAIGKIVMHIRTVH